MNACLMKRTLLLLIGLWSFAFSATSSSRIKAVIFDFGGVISQSDKQVLYEGVAHQFSVLPDEAKSILQKLKVHLEQGGDEQLFWQSVAESKGLILSPKWKEDFRALLRSSRRMVPGTLDIVKKLRLQGYQVALLSNVRKNKAEAIKELGHYSYFHPVVLSCDVGCKKPDLSIYVLLFKQLNNIPKEACLFVDNKLENVLAAQVFGMDAILFVDAEQLIKELALRGIVL